MKLIDIFSPIGVFVLGTLSLGAGYFLLDFEAELAGLSMPFLGFELTQIGIILLILSFVMWFIVYLLREVKLI
jgi:hypothetical protein